MKKLFMAFLAVATVAMVGCKKEEPAPTPTPTPEGGGEDPEIEIPEIAAPGAGKTTIAFYAEVCPKGAYLVGQSTPAGWTVTDDQTSFEAVQGAENWYAVTIDYAGDLEVKAIARPSDDDVALSWSYQWGMNFDPEDKNCTLPEGTENTKILKGDAEIKLGNGGEVALINLADNGVVYVQVKAWKTTPIIPNIPLEVAWIKTDWDGGDDNTGWEWKEMTAKGNGVFEYVGTWGGKGININGVGEDTGAEWYPDGDSRVTKQEGAKTGDEIKFTFTSVKGAIGTLKMDVVSASADVPAGNGTFVVTVANRTYTAGDECIFTGNFDEKAWENSDRKMTYDDAKQTWSWTGDYPKNFKYKVIYNGSWADGGDVVFDGTNYEATFNIQNN